MNKLKAYIAMIFIVMLMLPCSVADTLADGQYEIIGDDSIYKPASGVESVVQYQLFSGDVLQQCTFLLADNYIGIRMDAAGFLFITGDAQDGEIIIHASDNAAGDILCTKWVTIKDGFHFDFEGQSVSSRPVAQPGTAWASSGNYGALIAQDADNNKYLDAEAGTLQARLALSSEIGNAVVTLEARIKNKTGGANGMVFTVTPQSVGTWLISPTLKNGFWGSDIGKDGTSAGGLSFVEQADGEWADVVLLMNFKNNTYNMYINEELVAESYKFASSSVYALGAIVFRKSIDDIHVYSGTKTTFLKSLEITAPESITVPPVGEKTALRLEAEVMFAGQTTDEEIIWSLQNNQNSAEIKDDILYVSADAFATLQVVASADNGNLVKEHSIHLVESAFYNFDSYDTGQIPDDFRIDGEAQIASENENCYLAANGSQMHLDIAPQPYKKVMVAVSVGKTEVGVSSFCVNDVVTMFSNDGDTCLVYLQDAPKKYLSFSNRRWHDYKLVIDPIEGLTVIVNGQALLLKSDYAVGEIESISFDTDIDDLYYGSPLKHAPEVAFPLVEGICAVEQTVSAAYDYFAYASETELESNIQWYMEDENTNPVYLADGVDCKVPRSAAGKLIYYTVESRNLSGASMVTRSAKMLVGNILETTLVNNQLEVTVNNVWGQTKDVIINVCLYKNDMCISVYALKENIHSDVLQKNILLDREDYDKIVLSLSEADTLKPLAVKEG